MECKTLINKKVETRETNEKIYQKARSEADHYLIFSRVVQGEDYGGSQQSETVSNYVNLPMDEELLIKKGELFGFCFDSDIRNVNGPGLFHEEKTAIIEKTALGRKFLVIEDSYSDDDHLRWFEKEVSLHLFDPGKLLADHELKVLEAGGFEKEELADAFREFADEDDEYFYCFKRAEMLLSSMDYRIFFPLDENNRISGYLSYRSDSHEPEEEHFRKQFSASEIERIRILIGELL